MPHLLVQNKVEVVCTVTGRLLRSAAAWSSEQREQREAERRRTPPNLPEDEFTVSGNPSGQLSRHCFRRRRRQCEDLVIERRWFTDLHSYLLRNRFLHSFGETLTRVPRLQLRHVNCGGSTERLRHRFFLSPPTDSVFTYLHTTWGERKKKNPRTIKSQVMRASCWERHCSS